MATATAEHQGIGKLYDLLQGARAVMLTTAAGDSLRSRPMIPCRNGEDGALWFFTRAGDAKVDEALHQPRVNVSFMDADGNRYVSVSGAAALVRDREKLRELWDERERALFPRGPDDPELALLRVSVERAEIWDGPAGAPSGLVWQDVKIDRRPEGRPEGGPAADTTVVKVSSAHSPRGAMGQKYLASGVRTSMRLWQEEQPGEAKPPSRRDYETVGYVIAGRARLELEGQSVLLEAGDSWVVPRGARHTYRILEPFTAVEATSPPAEVHGRDEGAPKH